MKRLVKCFLVALLAALLMGLPGGIRVQASPYYNSNIQAYTKGTVSSSSVSLKWAKVSKAKYYTVQRCSESNGVWGAFSTICKKVKSVKYTDKKAVAGQNYEYRVTAKLKSGKCKMFSIRIRTEQPRALVLDSSGRSDVARVSKYLKNAGFSVSVVTDAVKVNERADVMVTDYDALVIPGGYSVNPSFYGQEILNTHSTYGDPVNDEDQIDAVLKFKEAGKPVLGICRGCQVVNVALGGTLKQCMGASHTHYYSKYRNVKIKKNSMLYGVFGSKEKTLHSHHQAIDTLGENLVATEWDAKDKTIEAFESSTDPIFGLQWHPDNYKSKDGKKCKDKIGLAVFKEFRSVCQTVMVQ